MVTAFLNGTTQGRVQGLIQPKALRAKMWGAQALWESHAQPCLEGEAIKGGFLKEESSEQNGRLAKQRESRIL